MIQSTYSTYRLSSKITEIAQEIKTHGGILMLVGGCVRDMLLGIESNDFDIEVYGLDLERLDKILCQHGEVFSVGKAFGILKVLIDGEYIDFSIPRRDSKIASGHTGFQVDFDSSLSYFDASKRRDFTINSILYDPITDEIIDPQDGYRDLENKIIRVTDRETFVDDPLRVYRGIRFAGRFGFEIEPGSIRLFQDMIPSIAELSGERIGEEWRKIFLQSRNLRASLELLFDIGILRTYYPDIELLQNIPQDSRWHAEGDVWIHTCMVLEQAQGIAEREGFTDEEKLILYFSALCHDLGKLTHTQILEDGRITAHGHEEAGVSPARNFLQSLFFPENTIEKIGHLIANHVVPSIWYNDEFFRNIKITDGAFRKLAKRLFPANMKELSYLCEADALGRGDMRDYQNTTVDRIFLPGYWIRTKSMTLGVDTTTAPTIITGKELLELGYEPGPRIGEIIQYANKLYDDEGLEKNEIIKNILNAFQ